MSLTLDLANELYPLTSNELFTLTIARSLLPESSGEGDGEGDGGMGNGDDAGEGGGRKVKKELWRGGDMGLGNDYDYVMYGKVGDWSVGLGFCGDDWSCGKAVWDVGSRPDADVGLGWDLSCCARRREVGYRFGLVQEGTIQFGVHWRQD